MKISILLSLALLSLPASIAASALAAVKNNGGQSLREFEVDPNNITTSTASSSSTGKICIYRIEVKTGSVQGAGTDARVSLRLAGADNATVLSVRDLESWGQMGYGHDYFEKGSLDVFAGFTSCVPTVDPCSVLLESDGSGVYPGWYVDYVYVSQSAGELEFSHMFTVKQWLATDEPPHKLYAYREHCGNDNAAAA